MNRFISSVLVALCGLLLAVTTLSVWAQSGPQLDLPRTTLSAGMHLIQVQVAAQDEQRAIGLILRKEMPPNEGMLFIFEQLVVSFAD